MQTSLRSVHWLYKRLSRLTHKDICFCDAQGCLNLHQNRWWDVLPCFPVSPRWTLHHLSKLTPIQLIIDLFQEILLWWSAFRLNLLRCQWRPVQAANPDVSKIQFTQYSHLGLGLPSRLLPSHFILKFYKYASTTTCMLHEADMCSIVWRWIIMLPTHHTDVSLLTLLRNKAATKLWS